MSAEAALSLSFPAVLTERRDAGAGMKLVTLTPDIDKAHAYRAPGQYIAVHAAAPGYFVLAGEIGAPSWEILVRKNGGASDALTDAPEGTVFNLAGPFGKGFPLERTHGHPLIVAVAGSALAVTRPILRSRIASREGPSTRVYIGVRTVQDVALVSEVSGWAHAGVKVALCLSQSGPDDGAVLPEATRSKGYVQGVLTRDMQGGHLEGGLVFAAGPAGMLEELKQLPSLRAAELAPVYLEVFTNV